jgi:hypothetical protein
MSDPFWVSGPPSARKVGLSQSRRRLTTGRPSEVLPIGVVLVGHGAPDKRSPSLARGRRPLAEVLHREHR